MESSKIKTDVQKLHATFDRFIRSKDIATPPSRHEKDFGEYVANALTRPDADWKRVDGMDGYIAPSEEVPSYVKGWVFKESNVDIMRMAVRMARVAEANQIPIGDFKSILRMTLRMMKIERSDWAN